MFCCIVLYGMIWPIFYDTAANIYWYDVGVYMLGVTCYSIHIMKGRFLCYITIKRLFKTLDQL